MTAYRKGFGDVIASGGYAMTKKYRHPELFIGVKKLENPVPFLDYFSAEKTGG